MTPHKSQIVNVVDLKLACEDARLRPEGDVGPWRAQTNRNRAPARGARSATGAGLGRGSSRNLQGLFEVDHFTPREARFVKELQ
jgi:hypothetical protein